MQGNRGGHNRKKRKLEIIDDRKVEPRKVRITQIYEMARKGHTLESIAGYCGVKQRHFDQFRAENDALQRALQEGYIALEAQMLDEIQAVITDNERDRTAALKLKAEFIGKIKTKIELSGPEGGPIELEDVTTISDEELDRLLEEAQKDLTKSQVK